MGKASEAGQGPSGAVEPMMVMMIRINITKGVNEQQIEAGLKMVMVDVMKLYWLDCLKSEFVLEFHHRLHWTHTHTYTSPEN